MWFFNHDESVETTYSKLARVVSESLLVATGIVVLKCILSYICSEPSDGKPHFAETSRLTMRKKGQNEGRANDSDLLLQNAPVLSWMTSSDGRLIYMNNTGRQVLKAHRFTLGERLENVSHSFAQVLKPLEEMTLRTGKPQQTTFCQMSKKRRSYWFVCTFMVPSTNNFLAGVAVDVSRQFGAAEQIESLNVSSIKLKHELATLRDLLVEAESTKEAFIANMNHDIRTPLSGIIATDELLLNTALDEHQKELAETIQTSGALLLSLLTDLLDFATPRMQPEDQVSISAPMGSPLYAAGRHVDDKSKTEKETNFENINDISKFSPSFTETRATISSRVDSAEIIDQTYGTVADLCAAPLIADLRIPVKDREEQADSGDSDEKKVSEGKLRQVQRKACALIVDDNAVMRKILTEQLKLLGIESVSAVNGKSAVEIFATARFDLVLMDINMPVMTGVEAAKAIRQHLDSQMPGKMPYVPILAITAGASLGQKQECLRSGIDECLLKPVSLDKLRKTLTKWLPTFQIGVSK